MAPNIELLQSYTRFVTTVIDSIIIVRFIYDFKEKRITFAAGRRPIPPAIDVADEFAAPDELVTVFAAVRDGTQILA